VPFFEKNLAALRENDATLADAVADAGSCAAHIEILDGRRGKPFVRMHGRSVTSRMDPAAEAAETLATLDIPAYPTLVVYGFVLGAHIRALWSRLTTLNRLFVIEPDLALFASALHYDDFSDILANKRAVFLVGRSPQEVYDYFVDGFLDFVASDYAFSGWDAYVRERDDYFKGLTDRIKDAIRTCRSNVATLHAAGSLMTANTIANLPHIWRSPGVGRLFGRFTGVPGVIVSAGPSLDKNVHMLSALKGKALICATDTAYKILCKRGVVPDLVFTIDFNGVSEKHFQGIEQADVPLVFDMEAAPTTLAAHHGAKFCGRGEKPFSAWVECACGEKGFLATGLSVAHYIFGALCAFGCERIVFVGQDLAFPGGKTHADGTHSQLAVSKADTYTDGKRMTTVISELTGEEMLTREDMYIYKCFFEKMVASTATPCVNATEGGAGIKGTQAMTLSDVAAMYADRPFDVAGTIATALGSYVPMAAGKRDAAIREFRATLAKTREAAEEIAASVETVLKRTEIYGLDRAHAARELSRIEKAASFVERQEFVLRLFHAKLLKNIFQQRREGAIDAAAIAKQDDAAYLASLRDDLDFQKTLIRSIDELEHGFSALTWPADPYN
jgi:hypothetical protein